MSSAPWRIVLASAIGTSHKSTGAPCQDFTDHRLVDTEAGPILVVAVSDGAGSAAYSEAGARLAVAVFIEHVTQYLSSGCALSAVTVEHALGWIEAAVDRLRDVAKESGHAERDYACTLLGAIVGPEQAAFIQVGDGAIVVSHGEEDGWSYVFWPQHGEYANTTNFIQSSDLASILAFDLAARRIDEIAMFSDGIENLVLHKASKSVYEPFFQKMIQPVRKSGIAGFNAPLSVDLQRYLLSKPVCERTDDDKTLILATRIAPIESTK
jgi:hypothetical protein